MKKYRIQSPTFNFTIPEDNIGLPANTTTQAVADGYSLNLLRQESMRLVSREILQILVLPIAQRLILLLLIPLLQILALVMMATPLHSLPDGILKLLIALLLLHRNNNNFFLTDRRTDSLLLFALSYRSNLLHWVVFSESVYINAPVMPQSVYVLNIGFGPHDNYHT